MKGCPFGRQGLLQGNMEFRACSGVLVGFRVPNRLVLFA